jgi:hypothetical protein
MRGLDGVPRSLIVFLAILATASFVAGSALEVVDGSLLAEHPYWGNLLSGMTGFSSSGLFVSVIFQRMQTRQQQQEFLHSIRPELERGAAQLITIAYRLLAALLVTISSEEEAAFIEQDNPRESARAFKMIASAPGGKKSVATAMPALVDAAGKMSNAFNVVRDMAFMTIAAQGDLRGSAKPDYLFVMEATRETRTWFWRYIRLPRADRENVLRDLTAAIDGIKATGVLDSPAGQPLNDALEVVKARANAFSADPDQGSAVGRALSILSRVAIGLPHTSVSSSRIFDLLRDCSTIAFRPLQLCADIVVTWALLLDMGHQPKLARELRAALADEIPGADDLEPVPISMLPRLTDVDRLLHSHVSAGESLVRSWYEQ